MTDAQPLVSVILPTFRRPALLRRSIQSVLAQTHPNLELIVVDDASPDETPDVVRRFDDPRLRYIRRETNGRAAATRNDGLAAARGDLIAFQDDDDIWLPHKLERQVAALAAEPADVGLLLCSYIRWQPDRIKYIGGAYHFSRLDYSRGSPRHIDYSLIATPGWLVRREALDRAGRFDPRFRSWDDWELGLRLWKVCKFAHVDEPLFIQDHVYGKAMMGNEAAYCHDMKIILEKHGHLWEGHRYLQSRHCYVAGRGTCMYETIAAGRPWLFRALRYNPFNLKAWGALFATLFGQDGVRFFTRLFHVFMKWRYAHHRLMRFWLTPR